MGTRIIPDYRSYALECRKLAANANSEEQRLLLMEMANTWLSFAERHRRANNAES
jgi:hypothetical protein